MARKVAFFELRDVADTNRDKGRLYKLTEMPATQAELWAARAFLGMANAGTDIPEDVQNMGMAGLARYSLSMIAQLRFDDARSLMEEMFGCVEFVPDPSRRDFSRKLVESDIEEISTRLKIRMEVLKLHLDFFEAVASSIRTPATTEPTG